MLEKRQPRKKLCTDADIYDKARELSVPWEKKKSMVISGNVPRSQAAGSARQGFQAPCKWDTVVGQGKLGALLWTMEA